MEQKEENEEGRVLESDEEIKEEMPTMTKSQLKKMKKKEKWLQVKSQKRKAEKERQKARKRACRERGEELGPSRKQLSKNKMKNSSCKTKVVIDCDFDNYMADKDIKMLVKQIQFSYSANRRAQSPMQFYCCGVSNKTKERLESLGDYRGWDIYFHSESFDSMFDKSSIVYLSSESTNVLQGLDDNHVYIIGGLVDHNHHKGLCYKMAEEKGLKHAQLPISEYIDMKTRKVLTINHVFEILLRYTETRDWQKAFYTVLPPRKGAIPKSYAKTNNKTVDGVVDPVENHEDCEVINTKDTNKADIENSEESSRGSNVDVKDDVPVDEDKLLRPVEKDEATADHSSASAGQTSTRVCTAVANDSRSDYKSKQYDSANDKSKSNSEGSTTVVKGDILKER